MAEVEIAPAASVEEPQSNGGRAAEESVAPEATRTEENAEMPAEPEKEKEPEAPKVDDIEAMAAKKRQQAQLAAESKKRGRRMFGLVQSTLQRAKVDVSEGKMGGAAQKRRELEERLAAKLNSEKQEMEEKMRKERESRDLRLTVIKGEEEISNAESLYKVRHDAKLNLAGFLCTKFPLPAPPAATDGISNPFAPRLPHVLRITNPQASRPIYWLPYRLLPSQEDQIDDQIDLVKKEIRAERDKWLDLKEEKQDAIASAKRKRDEQLDEMDRLEREERQKRRREAEDREERSNRSRRSPSREDRRMDDDDERPKVSRKDSNESEGNADVPTLSVKGTAMSPRDVGDDSGRMEGVEGEDDLEY